jgi:hypothetical protein
MRVRGTVEGDVDLVGVCGWLCFGGGGGVIGCGSWCVLVHVISVFVVPKDPGLPKEIQVKELGRRENGMMVHARRIPPG